jgi:hypothetical protein
MKKKIHSLALVLVLAGCGRTAELEQNCNQAITAAKAVYVAQTQKFPLLDKEIETTCKCAARAAVEAGESNSKATDAIATYWKEFAASPGKFDDRKADLERRFGEDAVNSVWTVSMNALLLGPVNMCQGFSG